MQHAVIHDGWCGNIHGADYTIVWPFKDECVCTCVRVYVRACVRACTRIYIPGAESANLGVLNSQLAG